MFTHDITALCAMHCTDVDEYVVVSYLECVERAACSQSDDGDEGAVRDPARCIATDQPEDSRKCFLVCNCDPSNFIEQNK